MGTPAILPILAQGPAPVQVQSPLDLAGKVAAIQGQRAQTAETQARIPAIQAQTQAAQAATQGAQIENALKQRTLDAYQTLRGLMTQHTTQLPDGSTAVDMPSVLGKFRSQFPDKAMELETQQLGLQEKRATVAKNTFELQAAQQKNVGFSLASLGFADQNAANDPQLAAKYASGYAQAQQNGTAHLYPTDPQTFAQNPQAWLPKLRDMATQSGALADAAKQKAELVDTQMKQLGQGRTMFAQGMESVHSPQDYAKLYDSISRALPPETFHALQLAPPNTVQTPAAIAATKQSAALTQMTPSERLELVEKNRHAMAEEANQRITAAAEASKATTAAGELALKRFETSQIYQTNGGNVPGGGGGVAATVAPATAQTVPTAPVAGGPSLNGPPQPSAPAAPGTPQGGSIAAAQAPAAPGTQPIFNVGGKQIDLNGNGPQARIWQKETPLVRQMATMLLTGQGGAAGGMGGERTISLRTRAADLASKIDPQYQLHAKAREDLYTSETAQKSVLAANTSIVHSQQFMRDIDEAGTGSIPILNRAKLAVEAEMGNPAPTKLEAVRQQYVAEIKKYFDGGAFTEGEYNRALDNMGKANSPAALKGAIMETNKMLAGGLDQRDKLINDVNNGGITGQRIKLLTDEAKQVLKDQKVLPSEVGDVVTHKDGRRFRITAVNPKNPNQYNAVPVP